jgi:hypothetical protein
MIGAAHKTILYDYVWAAKAPAYFFRSLLGDLEIAFLDIHVFESLREPIAFAIHSE